MADEPVAQVRAAMQRHLVHAILDNDHVARAHGLQVTDLQTLHLMVLRDDVRTPRQISTTTGMPASSVTKLVDRLEAAGYIKRTPDPTDRRRTLLELVPGAIEPLRTFYVRADQAFDGLSKKFSASELEVVARYLDAVSDLYAQDGSLRN
ncbi:MAG: MarR family transcriptional regulator [Brevibacterium aurantiacum]|nr:MarR family transcriptional regulator [Janibacter sp.]MDN5738397.1 MarR family transcriptional regulator [Brevibacterium aurantiacum]